MTEDCKPTEPGMKEVSAKFVDEAEAAGAKAALQDKTIPQETLLPLLDAPIEELAAYLAGESWEARKYYLDNMMADSIGGLTKYIDAFPGERTKYIELAELLLLALHVKIGQLLNAWDMPESPDKHAMALYSLSASSEHRHVMAKWMPGGHTSPPAEADLFEQTSPLAVFRRMSLTIRPGLSECWRQEFKEIAAAQDPEIDALFGEWQKHEDRLREIKSEAEVAVQRIPSDIRAKYRPDLGGPASDSDYHEHYVACGADALGSEADEVCDRISDIEKRLIGTPARTLGGLLTKARVAWHITALDHGLDELCPDLSKLPGLDDAIFVWSVLQDVERLAGEG